MEIGLALDITSVAKGHVGSIDKCHTWCGMWVPVMTRHVGPTTDVLCGPIRTWHVGIMMIWHVVHCQHGKWDPLREMWGPWWRDMWDPWWCGMWAPTDMASGTHHQRGMWIHCCRDLWVPQNITLILCHIYVG